MEHICRVSDDSHELVSCLRRCLDLALVASYIAAARPNERDLPSRRLPLDHNSMPHLEVHGTFYAVS